MMTMETKISFKNSHEKKLSAILSTPAPDKILPVIILCHGLDTGKDATTNVKLADIFLKNNIASFRLDFFAHGESEGKIEDRNVEEFVDDILCAIKFLKAKGYKKFGIYGGSFGGVASVIAASRNPDIKIMALKAAGMGQSRKMPNYKKDFDSKSWIKAGLKVKIPTLIVHGSVDEEIEVSLAKELAKSIKSSKLEIFKDADHRFSKKEDFDRCVDILSEFIISNIEKI